MDTNILLQTASFSFSSRWVEPQKLNRLYVPGEGAGSTQIIKSQRHDFNVLVQGVSNSRPGGQIRPVTSFDVAPQELAKNIISYVPLYRSTLPINYMSHNASPFVRGTMKRLAISCPRLLLSVVVHYEVITLSDNNPMQRKYCKIIHYFIYIYLCIFI